MNKVTLTICGTDYVVTTDESVGYMQELAAKLDTRIRNVMNSNERISMVMATVITALMQADEAKKAAQSADNLRKQLKTFFDDNNRTRVESESLRREIAQLRREKEELERKLAMR
jgi:cell division protein ZapA